MRRTPGRFRTRIVGRSRACIHDTWANCARVAPPHLAPRLFDILVCPAAQRNDQAQVDEQNNLSETRWHLRPNNIEHGTGSPGEAIDNESKYRTNKYVHHVD